ncbi:MAG: hypothetical protein AB8G11_04790 [Saprospiraceae bacterium]
MESIRLFVEVYSNILFEIITTYKREYIFIKQDKAQIDIYKREDNLWSIVRISGIEEVLLWIVWGLRLG